MTGKHALLVCVAVLSGCYGPSEAIRDLNSGNREAQNRAATEASDGTLVYTPELGEALIKRLEEASKRADTDVTAENVANKAIRALAEHKERRAVGVLVRLVEERPKFWHMSLEALGEIGDPEALVPLVRLADGRLRKGEPVPSDLAKAIARVVEPGVPDALKAAQERVQRGQPVTSEARWMVTFASERERRLKEALPVLLVMSQAENHEVRGYAAEGLGRSKSQKAVARLREMALKDPDGFVQVAAISALGSIANEEAVQALSDKLMATRQDHVPAGVRRATSPAGTVADWHEREQQKMKHAVRHFVWPSLAATQRASAVIVLMEDLDWAEEHRLAFDADYQVLLRGQFQALESLTGQRSVNAKLPPICAGAFWTPARKAEAHEKCLNGWLRWWKKNHAWVEEAAVQSGLMPKAEAVKLHY